jgi:beta-lactamase regulating signal transducer with metallopeptidase domain
MSAIEHLLREPAAQAIGWALLHFIWQGTLVAALTGMVLACLRKSAADIRYVVAAIGLSLMLTLPAVTAAQLWRSTTVSAPSAEPRAPAASRRPAPEPRNIVQAPAITLASPTTSRLLDSIRVEPWLPMLVFAWLCGVVVLSLRLVSGWLWVQRMKSHGTSSVEDGWNHIAARLSRQLHIGRRVRLLKSSLVDVPTVIGWVKPVILIPASALSGLTPHQLEAILAHELAHIRRHDYLVNLLQAVVETLLFYHPAVWWLSRRIRAERENCCDDLAVSLCGDPFTYAQALADLEGLRGSGRRFVMAANGGSLMQRVRRLLGAPSHAGRAPGWLAGSASVLVLLGIAIGTVGTDAFQTPAASAPASTPVVAATPQAEVVAAERAALLAAQASTPSVRAQSDAAERAREMARAEAALRAVLAEQGKSLADQERAVAQAREAVVASTSDVQFTRAGELLADVARAIAASDAARTREAVVASTPDAQAVLADASRALAALDAARVASTPVFQQSLSADNIVLAGGQTHGTYRWSNNGEKLEVSYDGEVEFTDDDTDVKRLSPGGLLKIRDGGMMTSLVGGHTVEFTADGSGNVRRRFWVGSSERPFEPEGHKWLASVLPRFIRQTAIGAPARVARILKAKGPAGVLAEVSLIEGSWGKRRYLTELLKTTSLDPATVRQVLVQAGREIDSDYELATLLIEQGDKLLVDDSTRQAYFDAARSIGSDFEMHRVFSAAVKRGPVSPTLLASLLNASREIDSDFEEASLLIDVAKQQPLDNTTRPAFFSALDTVQSDYEHRRVLSALGTRTDLPAETTAAMLMSGASLHSDFEAASFLLQIAKQQSIEGNLRAPFFRAVDSIGSAFERGRVLQAVASRPDASPETILAVLHATSTMDGSFEASQVLLTVASTHPVAGPSRDAYISAAEKLGDFEQGRVLAALVKNERRK